ncbi:MAG: CHRD domain-containing protein [Thermodesulfobacteriota bacterium]
MRKLIVSFFVLGATVVAAGGALAAPLVFRASLSGDQEVPTVDTSTGGTIFVSFDRDLDQLRFDLRVRSGNGITQAHFHCAKAGVNGAITVFLFGPVDPGISVNGQLASGTVRNEDIMPIDDEDVCGSPVNNVASLYQAMLEGRIYANVHSEENPGGVVRGQLFP